MGADDHELIYVGDRRTVKEVSARQDLFHASLPVSEVNDLNKIADQRGQPVSAEFSARLTADHAVIAMDVIEAAERLMNSSPHGATGSFDRSDEVCPPLTTRSIVVPAGTV